MVRLPNPSKPRLGPSKNLIRGTRRDLARLDFFEAALSFREPQSFRIRIFPFIKTRDKAGR